MHTNNKRIIRNTMFLYIRMLFVMFVSLYTSRIVLQILGIDDFGTYSVVGGVVAMLAFLNGALSNSTSRFLAFELGKKDYTKVNRVFNVTVSIHLLLAVFVFVLAETIGIWFVQNKLVITPERLNAAMWVYQFSTLTVIVSIIQTPYNALIIAHERMNVFAYVGVFETILRLGVVFLLVVIPTADNLIFYAVLMFIVSTLIAITYFVYCFFSFKESRYYFVWDKLLAQDIFSFSGWSLSGSLGYVMIHQGSNIVLNLFFGPAVNASKAIAVQVNTAVNSFVSSFRMAANPQIVKLYASEKPEDMKNLVMNTTKLSFFLVLILEIPILLETKTILELWLGQLPSNLIIFVRLTLLDTMMSVFDVSLYSGLVAINRIKENSMISPVLGFLVLPISWWLYKIGYGPEYVFYVMILKSSILSFVVKPILLCRFSCFETKEFVKLFCVCMTVALLGTIPSFVVYMNYEPSVFRLFWIIVTSCFFLVISSFFVGLDKKDRIYLIDFCRRKLKVNF